MNLAEYRQFLAESGFAELDADRIARLRISQRITQEPAKVRVEKTDAGEGEMYVYGPIGFSWDGDGTTPKMLIEQLAAMGPISRLTVRLNSPGGDAFDGLAMCNILQRQPCTVAVSIDALAASAATIVAMAASPGELTIAENGMAMVHRAWAVAMGNRNDMMDMASILEK